MRYAELFAGAGGLSLGLERAGMACVFHAELADFPRRVLQHHWPDTPLLSDVRALSGGRKTAAWMRQHFGGRVELLSGGSPCQDLSVAGKRAGIAGARSSLFFRQVRLWRVLNAPYLLWENVAGALSSNDGQDFALVLSALVGATVVVPRDGWGGDESGGGVAAGPDAVAAWRLLDAQWFGVPQRRLRVFVLAARAGGVDPAEILLEPESVRGNSAPRREAGEGTPRGAEGGAYGTLRSNWRNNSNPATEARSLIFDWQNSPSMGMACRSESSDSLRTNATPAVLAFSAKDSGADAGELAPTLRAGTHRDSHANGGVMPAVLAFDTTQITSPLNYSNPRAGDTDHPLAAGAHAPAICLTGEVTHALTHEGHDASEDGTVRGTPIVFNETGHERWAEEAIAGSLNALEAEAGV